MNTDTPLETLLREFAQSLGEDTFVRLALSHPAPGTSSAPRITARCVVLQSGPCLSISQHYATRDVARNIPLAEGSQWLRQVSGPEYRSVWLCTTRRDWQYFQNESGAARLVRHRPSTKTAPQRGHDEPREIVLRDNARDWLAGLGLWGEDGKTRPGMAAKFHQINRYLEIFTHLANDCGWTPANPTNLPEGPLVIADMGCGKAYLTFGLWHLFQRVWRQPVDILGMEVRLDLTDSNRRLAEKIDAQGLRFQTGDIASAPLPPLHALIALHACNTATDAAILRGVELRARLIMAAPCCHQELRPQLESPAVLESVLRHGVMAERMAEWLTDGLRALYLEWAGYRTKILEFIPTEHTPKNLLIVGIREREPFANLPVRERICQLKDFFGLKQCALDVLLNPSHETGNH